LFLKQEDFDKSGFSKIKNNIKPCPKDPKNTKISYIPNCSIGKRLNFKKEKAKALRLKALVKKMNEE
jgi:hypothetical protein